jgi:FkbM family methyltransferase
VLGFVRRALHSVGYDVVRFAHDIREHHLLALFSRMGVNCVLDVGAHVGNTGLLLRAQGFRGELVSFEPVASSFQTLSQHAARDERWQAHRLALGRRSEARTMAVNVASDLTSFRTPSRYGLSVFSDDLEVEREERVDVRRLDEIFSDVVDTPHPRAFLKIDTQGSELEVLEGATGCLDRIVGLQVELSVRALYEDVPTFLEAIPVIQRLGFEITGMYPVGRDELLRLIDFDCVLLRTAATGQASH